MYRVAMLSVHTCPLAALGGKASGGMNVYVRDLSRALGRRGLIVDVFTRLQDPNVPSIGALGVNARVVHLKAGPVAAYDKNMVYSHISEFTRNLNEFARQENLAYDVIHSHYWLSGLVAQQFQRDCKVPVVQMFHTLGQLKNQVANSAAERETPRRIKSEREIMSHADRLVAANPLEKSQMIWLYGADPDRIEVIPCGVDLNLFHPLPGDEAKAHLGMPQHHKMVLFVGRIEPLKGIDVLIEAMALALRDMTQPRDEICLCIIGGDPDADTDKMDHEMARLQKLREKLGIGDVVTFLGRREQDVLPYYYSAAEVCVVPSHYESFGMVALEAMACGTPVIASRVGGLTFTVKDGHTGFLIPSDEPQALAKKLSLLLTDGDLHRQMGREATHLAKRYSWSTVAGQIITLYRELTTLTRQQMCCGDNSEVARTGTRCCN